jgi:deoxyribonuclease V
MAEAARHSGHAAGVRRAWLVDGTGARLDRMSGAERTLYAAVDVHYPVSGGARSALVLADNPRFTEIVDERVHWLPTVAPYQPGRLFRRELPALRAVLAGTAGLVLIIVDGYVDLDPHGRPGLGAHLHAHLNTPVIGVAKTAFRGATHAIEVRRGATVRPLYVTSAGLDADRAATLVRRMAGSYRVPDALRRVDALARAGHQPSRRESTPLTGPTAAR